MSKEIIAVVRLMPGQGGYYDPYSRIHLTTGNPQAEIAAGTNCSQLLRSIRSGRLKLVSGSLAPKKPVTISETEAKTVIRKAINTESEMPAADEKDIVNTVMGSEPESKENAEPEEEIKAAEKTEAVGRKKKKSK